MSATDEGRCASLIRTGLALAASLNPEWCIPEPHDHPHAWVLATHGVHTPEEVATADVSLQRATEGRVSVRYAAFTATETVLL